MFEYRLKIFASAAKEGSLTKVADSFNISLSALSSHLKNLESELGFKLFIRHARGLELSEKGKALLAVASDAVDACELVRKRADEINGTLRGSVNIGLNTDPSFLELNNINQSITKVLPDVSVRFLVTETNRTEMLLKDREVDIGFTYGELDSDLIESIPFKMTKLCVVVPCGIKLKDHSWSELLNQKWIMHSGCVFIKHMKRGFEGFHTPERTIFAEDENVMSELLKSGVGVGVARCDKAEELESEGYVTIVKDKCVDVSVCMNYLKKRSDEEIIRRSVSGVCSSFSLSSR